MYLGIGSASVTLVTAVRKNACRLQSQQQQAVEFVAVRPSWTFLVIAFASVILATVAESF
jgi:hypothetical protein